jgi:hypothetical protein
MIGNLPRVLSLYNLRRLHFNTHHSTVHPTLNIPENRMTVEMFIENFKVEIGKIKEFFHVDWLICFSQVNSIDF